MTGATTSWANSRALSRSASCSWLSMGPPSNGLDGRDAVTAAGEMAVLAAGGGVPADQLGTELAGLEDHVDDELAREVHDVDVALVLLALLTDERRPRLVVGDGGDL